MEQVNQIERSPALLRAEWLLAQVLRAGVWFSAAVIFLGLLASWFVPSEGFSQGDLSMLLKGSTFDGFAPEHHVGELLVRALAFDPVSIISLGLMVLIALPIVRVGVTIVLFWLERDYFYFAITCFVFSILLTGIFLGKVL